MSSIEPRVGTSENNSNETGIATHELSELFRSGDEAALATLYDNYSGLVYSVALRVLQDPAKAEDVLQDVFLKVWRTPESFVGARGNLGPWLAVVARNRAIDVLRQCRSDDPCDELKLMAADNIVKDVEASLLLEKVKQAIRLLPGEQRLALDMAFFKGMTHAEIVAATGLPLGTVKTRIRSALHFLGKTMRGHVIMSKS